MFSWLAKFAAACIRPVLRYARSSKDEEDRGDALLWYRDLCRHSVGEFSFAVVQANECIEDHSQVETGSAGTFVGVYDGHGGPDASLFISDHLFAHLMRIAQENGTINEHVIRSAFSATEAGFLTRVRQSMGIKPSITTTGSCCLVGVIWDGTLYVANLGDSRAVVGCLGRSGNIIAEQLTRDHNASMDEVRQELRSLHPDDSQIVVRKHGVWRIKGIIQFLSMLVFSMDCVVHGYCSFSCSVPLPFLLDKYFNCAINNEKMLGFCGTNFFSACTYLEPFRCQGLLGMHILRGQNLLLIHQSLASGFQSRSAVLYCLLNLPFLPGRYVLKINLSSLLLMASGNT